ncbi:response regulator transcription factor [Undibacterium sp. Ji83W]|uniref:response regulator transcription factor n=1 Tax=Undibacterium sp. Ji83W TaxID=3413043 RepID=UPI003BF29264
MVNFAQEVSGASILPIIMACAETRNADDFSLIAQGILREVLPHEMMVCGIGGVSPQGNYVHKLLQFNCPAESYHYYQSLLDSKGRANSPLMQKWRETQEPVFFQAGRDDHAVPADWLASFRKQKMHNTVAHGMRDLSGHFSSYFIFTNLPFEVSHQHAYLLALLTPHLHLALAHALTSVEEFPIKPGISNKTLSERQREILHWLHEGKTNWEIATILKLTEVNVKYHIDQIFAKLDVRSRVHAVAKAYELGLLLPSHKN